MIYRLSVLLLLCSTWGCQNTELMTQEIYLTHQIPGGAPLVYDAAIVAPDQLIHKGVFSPDMSEFYFVVSDPDFEQFDTYVRTKADGRWSAPMPASFNSEYSDHGLAFSPDGNTVYFSSTRPVPIDRVAETWHLWKSEKRDGQWTEPRYVDIPNLRQKLVSHPTMSQDGTLYFHSSNLDYSEMNLYTAKLVNDQYDNAVPVKFEGENAAGKCTPYIAPDGSYLIYAAIEDELVLYISYKDKDGYWSIGKKLSDSINQFGQGNPSITPDGRFLFYTTGKYGKTDWTIKWVEMSTQ